MKSKRKRIVIGITGASGASVAVCLLKILASKNDIETHLIITQAGLMVLRQEVGATLNTLTSMVDFCYPFHDISSFLASGSFKTHGMIVVPCSVNTFSALACGITSSLLVRTADVHIKESRKIVLVVREAPMHAAHLENLTKLARLGCIIFPLVPLFYTCPNSIDAMVTDIVGRILDQLDIDVEEAKRWEDCKK